MIGKIFGSIFTILIVMMLVFYWFFPFNTVEFYSSLNLPENSNFTLDSPETGSYPAEMQFYSNMRYLDSRISYRIFDCPLYKQNDIEKAFKTLGNLTVLNFNPVTSGEEISATCESRGRSKGEFYIAGEGGPVNITRTDNFNVIFHGEILLIKESKCKNPNVAMHEILHALGFDHSSNPGNIMYETSKCVQTIGDDIINKINELYSVQPSPDLAFEEVSAVMNGKYLNTEISIRNHGLQDSEKSDLLIYADGDLVKEFELSPIKIGHGLTISLENIWVAQLNVDELEFLIDSSFNELNKNNNKIRLEIRES